MPVRPRFDPNRPLIAARTFIFAGRSYALGDPFPHPDDVKPDARACARQYEARAVNMGDVQVDPVQMIPGPKNGHYTITAPWLEKPIVSRGLKNAQATVAKVRALDPQRDAPGDGGADPAEQGGDTPVGPGENEPKSEDEKEADPADQNETGSTTPDEDGGAVAVAPGENEGGASEGNDEPAL